MKDKMGGVAIEEFLELKPKMYSILASKSSENKKAIEVNKNVTISPNEYKDVSLNKKCLRHSMNRIQSKNHRMGTYEVEKISLPCFDDKTSYS